MKILIEKFCGLSTDQSWQSWLYNYDNGLYRRFLDKLQASTGCTSNRELMADTLRLIDRRGGGGALADFLRTYHPDIIIDESTPQVQIDDLNVHGVFGAYSPGVVTYPRRMIFAGPDLIEKVREFVADKLKYDYIIIDDRAYVEYLMKGDSKIAGQIPDKNWAIAAYRKNRI